MAEKIAPVTVDDMVAASASGVLRALEARQTGTERFTMTDLVRSGFFVNIHIVAGGIWGPWISQRLGEGGLPGGMPGGGGPQG